MNKLFLSLEKPKSLYWAISATLLLFGIVMLTVISIQSFSSQRLIEHKIWRDLLESISAQHAAQIQRDDTVLLPTTGVIKSWYLSHSSAAQDTSIPAHLWNLPAGYYSTEGILMDNNEMSYTEGESFHALIIDLPSGKLITTIDIGEMENQQNTDSFISGAVGALLFLLIAIVIIWLRANLVRPVQDLANRLQAISPGREKSRLPTDYQREEIQIIAQATNSHLERVEQFIEREKSLLDQASHEFRTPIAIISGAVDVLKQMPLPDYSKPVLSRIENATNDLSETMVALLYLAREANTETNDITALHEVLPRLINDHKHLLDNKVVQLSLLELDPILVSVPESMVRIAVSNLIRNAIENTDDGLIEVKLHNGVISITDTGVGFDPVEAARRYRESLRLASPARGQGIGLFLIGRICDRFGWELLIENTPTGGTCAKLDLNKSKTLTFF